MDRPKLRLFAHSPKLRSWIERKGMTPHRTADRCRSWGSEVREGEPHVASKGRKQSGLREGPGFRASGRIATAKLNKIPNKGLRPRKQEVGSH